MNPLTIGTNIINMLLIYVTPSN